MELNEKIINLVKENMSETQKGLLGEFFRDFEKAKIDLKTTRESLEKTSETLKIVQKQRDDLAMVEIKMLEKTKAAEAQLKQLEKDKIEFDLKVAQKELEFMKNNFGEMRNLVETVFKNRRLVHTENYGEHIPGHQSSTHGWIQDRTINRNYTATQTEE